jgi:membrane-associated phospholipid phosphatase
MDVVNPGSTFGAFFDAFGMLPMPVLVGLCFAGLCVTTQNWIGRILFAILAYVAAVVTVYLIFKTSYFQFEGVLFWGLALGCGLLLLGPLLWCARILARRDHGALRRAAWIGIFTLVFATLFLEGAKQLWGRQRFRSMSDPTTQFSPWYQIRGYAQSDVYKSFPSGHSCRSAYFLLIACFPIRKHAKLIWIILAALWTLCVMVSRVIVGAHFATDVLCGAMLGITWIYVFDRVLPRQKHTPMSPSAR